MTGFGLSQFTSDDLAITVEVKSLNSKFMDVVLKIPKEFSDREMELRKIIGDALERGKASVNIDIVSSGNSEPKVTYDSELFQAYYHQLKELAKDVGADTGELFRLALHSPGVMVPREHTDNQEETWSTLMTHLHHAIKSCDDFRQREGTALSNKIEANISTISKELEEIEQQDPERLEHIKQRISRNLNDLQEKTKFDPNRFEQELIYYLEKLDITEEKVRLRTHIKYFLEVMGQDSPGKKLGFISQEIGREINTIGSKANDATIQKKVVVMKEELEKIKEQLLNIL